MATVDLELQGEALSEDRNGDTPAEQGLREAKPLELILGGVYDDREHRGMWERAGNDPPLDRNRPISQNIGPVAAVSALLLGGPSAPVVRYCRDQTDTRWVAPKPKAKPVPVGTGLNGRECGENLYSAYPVGPMRAALREVERRGETESAEAIRAWLLQQIVWAALGAVPWSVFPEPHYSDDLAIPGWGERTHGLYSTPMDLILADLLEWHRDPKWRRLLPDPLVLLSTEPADAKGLQMSLWSWRVWSHGGGAAGILTTDERDALRLLVAAGDLAVVLAVPSLDRALRGIRLRNPVELWRWKRASGVVMESSLNGLSTPCFGRFSRPGLTDWLDPHARAGKSKLRRGIGRGEASVLTHEPGRRIVASAAVGKLGDTVSMDLSAAGPLLYHLRWPADGPVEILEAA